MDSKLTKIKNLILEKERIDTELEALLGGTEKKRGRPAKDKPNESPNNGTNGDTSQ